AHGFSVLSPTAVFQYKCDEFYHPEADAGVQLNDAALGIDWMIPAGSMILSEKDKSRSPLTEADAI
ncbi:MAG: dTDP-4-dehydrorhamnose 3,5-epimerase family protein, partial [Bacteroidales bacterium]|nr:dTDP-4-dehydrorhamnose 3,5-epimerase family protein [Bacteroidales bacterium]